MDKQKAFLLYVYWYVLSKTPFSLFHKNNKGMKMASLQYVSRDASEEYGSLLLCRDSKGTDALCWWMLHSAFLLWSFWNLPIDSLSAASSVEKAVSYSLSYSSIEIFFFLIKHKVYEQIWHGLQGAYLFNDHLNKLLFRYGD